MKIELGKFSKDFEPDISIATCLEFVLVWGESSEDSASLLRVHAAALGVALEPFAMLPRYKPESDKIKSYGYKVLERLVSKNVSSGDIFSSGGEVLKYMMTRIPDQKKVEEKEDFFYSPEQEDKDT